jgi:hypothetical protein
VLVIVSTAARKAGRVRIQQTFSLNNVSPRQINAVLMHLRKRLSYLDVLARAHDGQLVVSIESPQDYEPAARFFAVVTVDRVLDEVGMEWADTFEWLDLAKVNQETIQTLRLVV